MKCLQWYGNLSGLHSIRVEINVECSRMNVLLGRICMHFFLMYVLFSIIRGRLGMHIFLVLVLFSLISGHGFVPIKVFHVKKHTIQSRGCGLCQTVGDVFVTIGFKNNGGNEGSSFGFMFLVTQDVFYVYLCQAVLGLGFPENKRVFFGYG